MAGRLLSFLLGLQGLLLPSLPPPDCCRLGGGQVAPLRGATCSSNTREMNSSLIAPCMQPAVTMFCFTATHLIDDVGHLPSPGSMKPNTPPVTPTVPPHTFHYFSSCTWHCVNSECWINPVHGTGQHTHLTDCTELGLAERPVAVHIPGSEGGQHTLRALQVKHHKS